MSTTRRSEADATGRIDGGARGPWSELGRRDLLVLAVVSLVVVSPIAVGAASYVGDTWLPVGDWASMAFRTDQVGTLDTPLIGTYTVKGWAHPGPFLFYAAAPLYHLTGGDTRALLWAGAVVNMVAIGFTCRVVQRRGGNALLLCLAPFLALLVHGFGTTRSVDIWNPNLAVFPFLLAVALVWDAALGRTRSLLWAVLAGSIAIQCHVTYAPLVVILFAWYAAWQRWSPRLLGRPPKDPDPSPETATDTDTTTGNGAQGLFRASSWPRRPLRIVLASLAVLWIPTVIDLVIGVHNPIRVARYFVTNSAPTVGLNDGIGLVSRFVAPLGPWVKGNEPTRFASVVPSGPVFLIAAVALVASCLWVARRRHLPDVGALAAVTLTLVVVSVPLSVRITLPAFDYLTQWLKVCGMLVWATVAWTAWRAWLSEAPAARLRPGAAAVAAAAVVAAAAWSWGPATQQRLPVESSSPPVQEMRRQINEGLPRGDTFRVVPRGDLLGEVMPGIFYYMDQDGHDVVTDDGGRGVKWGNALRWQRGEPVDATLTVAMHGVGTYADPFGVCERDPRVRLVTSIDRLSATERASLGELQLKRLGGESTLTAAERAEGDELSSRDFRVGLFSGPRPCAEPDEDKSEELVGEGLDNVLPVAGVAGLAAAAAGAIVLRSRRRTPSSGA